MGRRTPGGGRRAALAAFLERVNAGLRIDFLALEVACLDEGDAGGAALAGVEIGIEDAGRRCELDLGTFALANLDPGPAEMLDELTGRHPVQVLVIMTVVGRGRPRLGRGLGRDWLRYRPWRTGGD